MKNTSALLIGPAFVSFSLLTAGSLAGCSPAANERSTPSDSSAQALALASGELELRVESERVPDWLIRLSHDGDNVSGHVVLHLDGAGTSDRTPGNVAGTVSGDGSVTLFIEAPAASRPLPATRFTGKVVADGIVGTLDYGGRDEPVKLTTLPRGATDALGVPLVATTRHETELRDCRVDVTSAEFFALPNDALQQRLNDLFSRQVADAPKLCTNRSQPVSVSGGGRVTLLRDRVVSVATVYSVVFQGDDRTEERAAERHTFALASGRELTLFGDVLEPGTEAKLLPLLQGAVDAVRSDVLDESMRAEVKKLLASSLAEGRLGQHYGLTDDAIVFDVPAFERPVSAGTFNSVRVPYAAFGTELRFRSSL